MKSRNLFLFALLSILCLCAGVVLRQLCIDFWICSHPLEDRPLSREQVLEDEFNLPIYGIDPSSPDFGDLSAIYYYSGLNTSDGIRTMAYFTRRAEDNTEIRVARLEWCNLCNVLYMNWRDEVAIEWAGFEGRGYTCEIEEEVYTSDRVAGERYQSCLNWPDNSYLLLYTIWPEDRALEFARALVLLEP